MQETQAQPQQRLVEIVLTDEQVGLLAVAAGVVLRSNEDKEHGLVTLTDEEKADYERLAVFMTSVESNPQHFPVTGRMARSVKKRTLASRLPKPGAGDTGRSVRNKRKARQERRIRFHKERRQHRRETAEAFNKAREQMEQEIAEMQAIQEQRQLEIENEPKFNVVDIMGNVVMARVPQSMILPEHDGPSLTPAQLQALVAKTAPEPATQLAPIPPEPPRLILPGTAEHLGVELETEKEEN